MLFGNGSYFSLGFGVWKGFSALAPTALLWLRGRVESCLPGPVLGLISAERSPSCGISFLPSVPQVCLDIANAHNPCSVDESSLQQP